MVHLSGSTRFLTPIWSFFFFSSLSSQETMAANTATRIPAWRVFEIFMLHQYLWMESKECFLSEFQSLMRDDMSPLYLSLIFLFSHPLIVNKFGMFTYTNVNSWSSCEFKMPWYQVLYCNRDTYYLYWVLTSGPLA